jgi:YVTN family beta-propeller protein
MYSHRSLLHRVAISVVGASALLACAGASEPTAITPSDVPSDFTAIAPRHPQGVLSGKVTSFTGRPFGIDVTPKGGLVLVTEQDANAVAGFPITKPAQPITPIPVTADPGDVIFNTKGTTAYASTFFGGNVHVIDGATGAVTATIPMGSNAYRLAISKDDTRLYVTSVYGDVRLVKLTTGFPITPINLGASIQGITLSPDGTALYVSSTSGSIWRLDPLTLAVQATGFVGGTPQELVISPDGTELYVANEAGAGIVVNAATLTATGTFPAYYLFGMALTPDGQQLYAASSSGTLTIIDRATRTVVNSLYLGGTPRRIAFDEKGFTAVVANEGNWVDVIK